MSLLTFILVLFLASPAAATRKSSYYNQPGQKHNNDCVDYAARAFKKTPELPQLRYPDASPTGFLMDPKKGFSRKKDFRCPPNPKTGRNRIRFDAHEELTVPFQGVTHRLYFARGGKGYKDDDVRYGWISRADIKRKPSVKPPMNGAGKVLRNGSACRASRVKRTQGHYRLRVKTIPEGMRVKRAGKVGASWEAYGDPAADQGDKRQPQPHYTYLLWNWPNVENGGIVRSPVMDDQEFYRCDVEPIRSVSFNRARKRNGWVKGVYGKMFTGGRWLYGWVVHSHDMRGDNKPPEDHYVNSG